jgi:hypothetical protein
MIQIYIQELFYSFADAYFHFQFVVYTCTPLIAYFFSLLSDKYLPAFSMRPSGSVVQGIPDHLL